MKTTQGKAVSALIAINRISGQKMPSFAAYKLFRLRKKLKDVAEFQSEQEEKLVEELGGKINELGNVIWNDLSEKAAKDAEYAKRHKELEDMDCEIYTEKIMMTFKEISEITPRDMEAMDDFIEWKE